MAQFLAVAAKTQVSVLEKELSSEKFKVDKISSLGVYFSGNWQECLRAHLTLRNTTRILLPVLEFTSYKEDELYNNILKHDFTKYITVKQPFMVESSAIDCSFKDSMYLSLKVKDAIADQFRSKFGSRPNVSKTEAELRVVVKGFKNNYLVAVDTTGGILSERGYRKDQGPAPLREGLAASLIDMTGWTSDRPFVDPMCGSGTLPIEAALKANKKSMMLRKQFAFQSWKQWISQDWSESYRQVARREIQPSSVNIFGFDHNPRMVAVSNLNSEAAGTQTSITFKQQSVADFSESPWSSSKPGVLVVNPPYGERLGDVERLQKTYKELGSLFKNHFRGWDCWVLSGNAELTKSLSLKSTQQIDIFNGPIKCKFLHYPMY